MAKDKHKYCTCSALCSCECICGAWDKAPVATTELVTRLRAENEKLKNRLHEIDGCDFPSVEEMNNS
jgi:hypothetical protein